MGVGGASPTAGTSCATCLRKFTVHFRRPYKYGEKPRLNGTSYILKYNGEFGFDWLRDEYIYPIVPINKVKKPVLIIQQTYGMEKIDLKQNYTKGVRKISPFGTEYIPAHLAIFATNPGSNKDSNISTEINKNGALLSIEVHQINSDADFPLSDDGTNLIFEASDPAIKISTVNGNEKQKKLQIPLKDFLSKQLSKDLGVLNGVRKYYVKEDHIRVTCEGATTNGAYIQVKAKRNKDTEEIVGILHIAPNNKIPKARICLINVIVDNLPVKQPVGLDYRLKYQAFNQALVRAEIVKKQDFNVVELYKKYKAADLKLFLDKYYNINESKESPRRDKRGYSIVATKFSEDFKKDVCQLYEKYHGIKKINSDETKETYVFFSNIIFFDPPNFMLLGSAVHSLENSTDNEKKWGNAVVLLHAGSMQLEIVVHEILHSFGITHIFDKDLKNNRYYHFHKGFTDNFMDYQNTEKDGPSKFAEEPANTKVKKVTPNNQVSLFRYQWDLLKKDRSIDIK